MFRKKIFAGIALATSVSLITPMSVPFISANTVAMAMETDTALSSSGTLPCENGETIEYTFENGVLTISGKGDKLVDKYSFSDNDAITKVVFTEDCTLESMDYMFEYCNNLSIVENIPDTVISMDQTFSHTALTEVPELPAHIEQLDYTFSGCTGITEVDFSKLPSTIHDFSGAFKNTGVTNVTITFPETREAQTFTYTFSDCSQLKTMVIDASNLNPDYSLWLHGLCSGCSALESFELKNIPDNHSYPGADDASQMFEDCENLTSVKNEGYFYFSGDSIFKNCSKLKTIETRGFVNLYSYDSLENAFMSCETLEGTYYIQLSPISKIYEGFYENKYLEKVKENLTYTFKGCSEKVTFYINCKPLVDYCNELKTTEEYAFAANVLYWEDKDFYEHPDASDTSNPTETENPATDTPTDTDTPVKTSVPTNTTEAAINTNAPNSTTGTAINTNAPSSTTGAAINTNAPTSTTGAAIHTNAPTNTTAPSTNTSKPSTNTNMPDNNQTTPTNTNTPTNPQATPNATTKKTITTLKLTKYKKGTKKITGKTIKNAKVVVTVNGKTYKVTSNKKGTFTVKLKAKIKAKTKIKVVVSKSGYTQKSKTYKVK